MYYRLWLFPYKKNKFRQPTRKKVEIDNVENNIPNRLQRECLNVVDHVFEALYVNKSIQAAFKKILKKKPAKVLFRQRFIYNWQGSGTLPRKLVNKLMSLKIDKFIMSHDDANTYFAAMNHFFLAYNGVAVNQLTFTEALKEEEFIYTGPDPLNQERLMSQYIDEFKKQYTLRISAHDTQKKFITAKNVPQTIIKSATKHRELGRNVPVYLDERYIDVDDDATMNDAQKSLPNWLRGSKAGPPKKKPPKKKKKYDEC